MGLQAKKHHPQEVPRRSSTQRANLWAAPGVPPFSPIPIAQVPEDRLTRWAGVTGRPSHGQRAASVTASGTGARGQGQGQKPDRSFFSAGNALRLRENYPKWLLAHVYSLPESELIQQQLVYAIG